MESAPGVCNTASWTHVQNNNWRMARSFCPKPKPKANVTALSGKWSVKTVCSGNRIINGVGYSAFSRAAGKSVVYSVSYQNELGDKGAGSLTHSVGSKSAAVRLKLRDKWYYYPLIKISNSRWQGKSKSGCQITFSR